MSNLLDSDDKPENTTFHYVVRTYSGPTAQKTLWKVLSRPIINYSTAVDWKEFIQTQEPNAKDHEFFIVTTNTLIVG